MEKLLFDIREAAERMGLSQRSVRLLVKSGQLASIRVGTSIRIRACDLLEFCATGTAATALRKL